MGFMDKMKEAATKVVEEATQRGDQATTEGAPALPSAAALPVPLYEVESHIAGKNAKVRLWPDRLEWERPRGLSAGKITAGLMTAGASLAMTGVKGGKDEHDMVLLRHITNVSDHREGMFHHTVDVQTSAGSVANTISFHVSHDEAAQFRQAIVDAISALHARAEAPISVVVERPSAPPPSAGGTDLAAQLQQLAGLRDAGILTEEEFAAKKSEILSRF